MTKKKLNSKVKKTGNAAKGFGSNPQNINRKGRPKGSRNRSTLLRAQVSLDDMTTYAAKTLEAIMKNDKEFLNTTDDVPVSLRISAAKEILNKSIANEKDKVLDAPLEEPKDEPKPMTTFSSVPVASIKRD